MILIIEKSELLERKVVNKLSWLQRFITRIFKISVKEVYSYRFGVYVDHKKAASPNDVFIDQNGIKWVVMRVNSYYMEVINLTKITSLDNLTYKLTGKLAFIL